MVDPSNVVAADANGIEIPVALLPSQGEDKRLMHDLWDIFQLKPMAKQCVRKDLVSSLREDNPLNSHRLKVNNDAHHWFRCWSCRLEQ